nr:MAG TPA: hypothetical protein [Caudoviricetes sp.]
MTVAFIVLGTIAVAVGLPIIALDIRTQLRMRDARPYMVAASHYEREAVLHDGAKREQYSRLAVECDRRAHRIVETGKRHA